MGSRGGARESPATMKRPRATARCFVAAGVFALLLTACSGEPDDPLAQPYTADDASTWPFDELIEFNLAEATAARADAEQIAALERARGEGSVTVAQYREATEAERQCLADAGYHTSAVEPLVSMGQERFQFTWVMPAGMDEHTERVTTEGCYTRHKHFIDKVYSNQPAARESLLQALTLHEAQLRTCLAELDMQGRDFDELEIPELWEELKTQSFGGEEYGYSTRTDCIIDAGINW